MASPTKPLIQNSPKGLALYEDTLYIADVKSLAAVDLNQGKISRRYTNQNIQLLNGIAVDNSGEVFVSDWLGNSIYHLKDGVFTRWLHSRKLNSPNGLWVDDDTLTVASWGSDVQADFSTRTTGALLSISRTTKEITTHSIERPWVNMDGISASSSSDWLISDFLQGEVILVDKHGKTETLPEGLTTPADFLYIPQQERLVIPSFATNRVISYQFKDVP